MVSDKASGGDGIPVELFQVLKYAAVKVLHSTCQQIWKTQQRPQDWKRSIFIPIPKKSNAKEYSNYHTIVQARLQRYVNWELPDVQAGFRKGKGTRDQITNILWIIEKTWEFQTNVAFLVQLCTTDFTSLIHRKKENNRTLSRELSVITQEKCVKHVMYIL